MIIHNAWVCCEIATLIVAVGLLLSVVLSLIPSLSLSLLLFCSPLCFALLSNFLSVFIFIGRVLFLFLLFLLHNYPCYVVAACPYRRRMQCSACMKECARVCMCVCNCALVCVYVCFCAS